MPLLTLVWPVTIVVPIVVALDYLGSASQGVGNVARVAWHEQLAPIPLMVVGVAGGLWALSAVPTALLARILGGFVTRSTRCCRCLSRAARARPRPTAGSRAGWSGRCSAPAAPST